MTQKELEGLGVSAKLGDTMFYKQCPPSGDNAILVSRSIHFCYVDATMSHLEGVTTCKEIVQRVFPQVLNHWDVKQIGWEKKETWSDTIIAKWVYIPLESQINKIDWWSTWRGTETLYVNPCTFESLPYGKHVIEKIQLYSIYAEEWFDCIIETPLR